MKRILPILAALVFSLAPLANVLAQQSASVPTAPETMRAYGKLPVVAAVIAIIFAGIVVYLVVMDRKMSRIEKELNAQKG